MAIWRDCLWAELFDDESGEARPVTILNVDDALFTRSAARADIHLTEADARRAFLDAFPDRLRVQRWLVGSESPGEALLPLLILCCLAASEAADSDDNDYRGRMRDLMGWDDRIINCAALPRLWMRFVALNDKRSDRTPTRPLILPDPRFRTQIGHAIELTFPSRNDARRLAVDLRGEEFDFDAPRAVLAWLEPLVAKQRYSPTFLETFRSFREAWLAAERSLADHRFWSGWKLATRDLRPSNEDGGFEIVSDEWGARHIINPIDDSAMDLERAIRARDLPGGVIGAATKRHVIPLIEGEWGRLLWAGAAKRNPPSAALIRQLAFGGRYQSLGCTPVTGAEGWGLTFDVAAVFGDRAPGADRDRLIDITPVGCTRVDGGLLARPALPFNLEAVGYVETLAMVGNLAEMLAVQKVATSTWRVTPREPITGEVRVVAQPRAGGAPFERRLRLKRAILAPTFRDTIPDRLYDGDPPPAPNWPTTAEVSSNTRAFANEGLSAPTPALSDLIEFLAVRTAPLPLSGFADLIRSALGDEGVRLWDVIQALRDAGVIKILDVRGWRGRAVLSRRPRGAIARRAEGWALVFEGCLHETWLARLTAAASRLGLAVTQRYGVGPWSPPTPTIVSEDATLLRELASLVETPVGYAASSLEPIAALNVAPALTATETRTMRRDVELQGHHAPLAFLDTERANVTPTWEVRRDTGPTFWRNRDDAVLDAYVAVGSRPFRRDGSRLWARDARLPTHVARWLRLTLGVAAGPAVGGGYGYAFDEVAGRELARIAPTLFGPKSWSVGRLYAPRARQWRMVAVPTPGGPRVRPLWDAIRSADHGEA